MKDQKLILKTTFGAELFILPDFILSDHWHHLCITFLQSKIQIFSHGETITRRRRKDNVSNDHDQITDNSTSITFGTSSFLPLLGQIANVLVLPYLITIEDEISMSNCSFTPKNFLRGQFSTKGAVRKTLIDNSTPCEGQEEKYAFIFFSRLAGADHRYSEQFCQNLKGRMVEERDVPMVEKHLYRQISFEPDIRMAKQSNDTQCRKLQLTRHSSGTKLDSEVSNTDCKKKFFEVTCIIPRDAVYKLRGLKDEVEFKPQRHGNNLAFTNKQCHRIIIELFFTSSVMFNELSYEVDGNIRYKLDSRALETNNDIVGRKPWIDTSTNRTLTLSLSTCNFTTEFTCNDGTCISLEKRCDSSEDCPYDDSDEIIEGCHVIDIPPTYSREFCASEIPLMNLSISVAEIQDVNIDDNSLKIELTLNVMWRDPRLTFMHLSGDRKKKNLGYKVSQIWLPSIYIENSKLADIIDYKSHKKVVLYYFAIAEYEPKPHRYNGFEGKKYFVIHSQKINRIPKFVSK